MSIHLTGPSRHSPGPPPGGGADVSLSAGRGRSLGSGRPCPFLGSQDGPGLANGSPSRMNVCHAHSRKEWRGFRRVTIPYSRLTREKQAEVCFASFNQCPYHQQASGELEAGRPAPRAAAAPAAHRPRKRRSPRGSRAPMSNRKRTLLQFTGLGVGAMICAFIVSFVISSEPSRLFDYVFDYLALQDIKSMGLAGKEGDPSEAGLARGGDLRAKQLKDLSASQREKLKAKFGNLSDAEKQKLKEKYKAMMGK